MDLIKESLPRTAVRLPGQESLLRDVRASLRRHGRDVVVPHWQQGAAGWTVDAAQLSFDRFAQVLQQVEPVGDLPRLVRTVSRALRVETASIAADDFDLGMPPEPFGRPGRRTIVKDVDNRPPLEVDDDGPIRMAFSPAPVVHARDTHRRDLPAKGDLPLQMPEDCVVADRDAQALHQPLSRPPAGRMAEEMDELSGAQVPATVRKRKRWKEVGKGLSPAFVVQAPPPAYLQVHRNLG
jgi:hypothetical protein